MSDQIINFKDALSILDNLSKNSFAIDAWIPSLQKTIKIKELTTKQQSVIIENFFDFIENKSTFSKTLFDIISENCLEDSSVIENLTIFDRACLAFFIRKQLSNKLKIEFQEIPKIEKEIEIDNILEKFKSYTHPKPETIKHSLESVAIEIELDVPKMKQDPFFDNFVYRNAENSEDFQKFKTVLGNAFLAEIAKFIKEIKINGNLFGYNNLYVDDKISVIEKLPAVLINDVNRIITIWKSELEKNYTVKEENIEKVIKIDSFLFLIN